LVTKGYSQKQGIDYNEVFAQVTRLKTIQLIITTIAQHRWKIYQMDAKSALLNSFLEKEVYIEQPMGCERAWRKCIKVEQSLEMDLSKPQELGIITLIVISWRMKS